MYSLVVSCDGLSPPARFYSLATVPAGNLITQLWRGVAWCAALLSANLGAVGAGQLVLDPCCGSGSMVLAAAAIAGEMTVGADANLAVLAGEINRKRNKGHTPTSNFQQCVPLPCAPPLCPALRPALAPCPVPCPVLPCALLHVVRTSFRATTAPRECLDTDG